MHLVVCVKQVPDTAEVRIDPETNTLIRQGVPSIINPYDAHAVEAAVRLKEEQGGKVTLLSMGPPQAEETLRKGLTFGADEAILLSDRAFAGSDTLATSYILTKAIQKIDSQEKVDIILCGKQAIDGDTAQVGPGIATRLGIPQLTYVMKIDYVDLDKKEIQVKRQLEGFTEVLQAKLPALLTVNKEVNELRYATLPNMIKAAQGKIITWTKDDLDVDTNQLGLSGSPTSVSRIFPPEEKGNGEIIGDGIKDPVGAAQELVNKLVKLKITADR